MEELDLHMGNTTDDFFKTEDIFEVEETLEEIPYGDYSYCKNECEFYEKCWGNKDSCVKNIFYQILNTLTPREDHVLKLRYGLDDGRPRTLEEVGKEFGVTRERIRQIEAKAIRKLRHPTRAKRFGDFKDAKDD